MAWVVDTCVLLDVALADRTFAGPSSELLARRLRDGLVIAPVTFIEMAPAFSGSQTLLEEFLSGAGVDWRTEWSWADTEVAFGAWNAFIARRRAHSLPRRPVADALIGAFASRFEGLLTRNVADFRALFPRLRIIEPR